MGAPSQRAERWRRATYRGGPARLLAAVSAAVADAGDALPCDPGRVLRADLTSTGMLVATLGHAPAAPLLVAKVAVTAAAGEGLARETRTLRRLAADERLGDWRALIPQRHVVGSVLGRPYAIDTALPGRSARSRTAQGRAALAAAARAIDRLHRATATTVEVDDAQLGRWVRRPVEELLRRAAVERPRRARALERLAGDLDAALRGRVVTAGWVHGDFWAGNVLLAGGAGEVTGIIDWDAAGDEELPLHDILHLALYGRRVGRARELGDVVCRALAGGRGDAGEREVVRCAGAAGLEPRDALLLYWLRHSAVHLRQQVRHDAPRHRLWQMRNLDPVLARL
jgi:aminoglycoside phosphotransferase (APT) family kinase protein